MKHKLNLLKEKEENVCSATKIYFINAKEILKCMKCEHMCFAIIPKDSKEEVEEVLAEVVDMLGEFFYIVSANAPDGLPPMRKINH